MRAVRLSCGHIVLLVPPLTPDEQLPDHGPWTKSQPDQDGLIACPACDFRRVHVIADA